MGDCCTNLGDLLEVSQEEQEEGAENCDFVLERIIQSAPMPHRSAYVRPGKKGFGLGRRRVPLRKLKVDKIELPVMSGNIFPNDVVHSYVLRIRMVRSNLYQVAIPTLCTTPSLCMKARP